MTKTIKFTEAEARALLKSVPASETTYTEDGTALANALQKLKQAFGEDE